VGLSRAWSWSVESNSHDDEVAVGLIEVVRTGRNHSAVALPCGVC
jgi:hypothetical protein